MKIYFASDHAGFELKNELLAFVRDELHLEVQDCGALVYDPNDDYPALIASAARSLSRDVADGKDSRAIIIGASGQGEAIVANRYAHVRAVVYYGATGVQTDISGNELDMISSTRAHNDANALSLGARFISLSDATTVVQKWLSTPFSGEERHTRRIAQIDALITDNE